MTWSAKSPVRSGNTQHVCGASASRGCRTAAQTGKRATDLFPPLPHEDLLGLYGIGHRRTGRHAALADTTYERQKSFSRYRNGEKGLQGPGGIEVHVLPQGHVHALHGQLQRIHRQPIAHSS